MLTSQYDPELSKICGSCYQFKTHKELEKSFMEGDTQIPDT